MDGTAAPQVEVRARVVVAVEASDRAVQLAADLGDAGFDVTCSTCVPELAELLERDEPAVAIVDDGGSDWLRTVSDLVRLRPGVRPLALVDVTHPEEFLSALTSGVAGFVSPSASPDAVERSVRELLDSGVAIPRRMVSALVAEVRHGRGHRVQTAAGAVDVTDREWQILQMLIQRRSTRDITETLFVSVGTVRSHVSALLRKLGAIDREDAIRLLDRRTSTSPARHDRR